MELHSETDCPLWSGWIMNSWVVLKNTESAHVHAHTRTPLMLMAFPSAALARPTQPMHFLAKQKYFSELTDNWCKTKPNRSLSIHVMSTLLSGSLFPLCQSLRPDSAAASPDSADDSGNCFSSTDKKPIVWSLADIIPTRMPNETRYQQRTSTFCLYPHKHSWPRLHKGWEINQRQQRRWSATFPCKSKFHWSPLKTACSFSVNQRQLISRMHTNTPVVTEEFVSLNRLNPDHRHQSFLIINTVT